MKATRKEAWIQRRLHLVGELASGPCSLRRFGRDLSRVALYFWCCLRLHWRAALGLLALGNLLILFFIRPLESGFNPALREFFSADSWKSASDWISWSGEYLFHLLVFLPLLLLGKLRRSRKLQTLAACVFLCVILAGITVRIGKICFGRVRPIVAERKEMPDTFYGPTLNPKHHSYPSGHTAAAFAAAAPLQLAHPLIGLPASAYATTIGLSRSINNQHYLSDLLGGFFLGIFISLPTGWLLQDLKKFADP